MMEISRSGWGAGGCVVCVVPMRRVVAGSLRPGPGCSVSALW